MNAEWENARCMHGNLPSVCWVQSCATMRWAGRHLTSPHSWCSDLDELVAQNRSRCHHDGVPQALTPDEEEAEIADGLLMGRFDAVLCTACQRIVPTRRPDPRAPRVLSVVP